MDSQHCQQGSSQYHLDPQLAQQLLTLSRQSEGQIVELQLQRFEVAKMLRGQKIDFSNQECLAEFARDFLAPSIERKLRAVLLQAFVRILDTAVLVLE